MKFKLPHASSSRGAQMGRPDFIPFNLSNRKFYLNKLKMVDGAYDEGGAYWGMGTPVYWAHNAETDSNFCQVFFRAKDRKDAKAILTSRVPNATFFS